jgi:hypothetical protein
LGVDRLDLVYLRIGKMGVPCGGPIAEALRGSDRIARGGA